MSFSSLTKEELIRLPLGKSCCVMSELSALVQTSGSLQLRGGGRVRVAFRVENAALARRIFQLLRAGLGITPRLHFVQHTRLGGRRTCVLTLDDADAQKLLLSLHMMEQDEDGGVTLRRTVPRHPMTRQCCRRSFLRGAFLGAGTMSDPEKDYHFELIAGEESLRQTLEKLLEKSGRFEVTSSIPNNLELNGKGVDKGKALLALAGILGLERAQVMACGDSSNDVAMLRAAGLGVAMGNATPEALAAADVQTASNDEDGVALAIRRYVLSGEGAD